METEKLQKKLTEILGDRFSTSDAVKSNYAKGEDIFDPIFPIAVVFPKNNEEDAIRFNSVDFSYGRETVLNDVSFSIKQGEKVAIVGETGAGKSTIAKLILRFYLPSKGDLKYFGVESELVDQKWVRKNIAYVPQESFLFRGSIRDNLLYSDPLEEFKATCIG